MAGANATVVGLLAVTLLLLACNDNDGVNDDEAGDDFHETEQDAVAAGTVFATQVVYLKLLPELDDALAQFGLLATKAKIIERMLTVVHRDYDGYDIAFVTDSTHISPDIQLYSTVEITGDDPGGQGLLGFDNTVGKDVGNLRLDDYLGGYNFEAATEQYAGYGGIFVAEFLRFSLRMGDDPLASRRFDDVFGFFIPSTGGIPVTAAEVDGVGSRSAAVSEAVRVLGNLIGNTISHEVGHSLGLVAADGQYHNENDSLNMLMDKGGHRPFEERAELDGQGPERFSAADHRYLDQIL